MEERKESEAFMNGVVVGLNLYNQKIISACRNGQPLVINGNVYYVESGKDRLREMLDKIYV